jgi:hypothetical protein
MPQQLNLLDPGLLPPQPWLTAGPLVLVLGLAFGAVFTHSLMARDALALALKFPGAEEPASTDAAAPDPSLALQAQVQRNAQLLGLLREGAQAAPDSAAVLATVVQGLPANVWLTSLEVSAPQRLRIEGGTLEPQALQALSLRLAASPALKGWPIEVLRLSPRAVEEASSADGEAVRTAAVPAYLFSLSGGLPDAAAAAETGSAR